MTQIGPFGIATSLRSGSARDLALQALLGGGGALISLDNQSVPEDLASGEAVGTLSVQGGSGSYTFSITDDPDSKFAIDGDVLETADTLDFDTASSHAVTIEADNGVDPPISRVFTITVTDVDDTAPTITSANSGNNVENTVLAHALTANESVTWSIIGGADQARFEISGSTLRWLSNGTKDFEAPDDAGANNTYVVDVRATDGASNTADQTITITVTDVDDTAPTITSDDTINVDEDEQLAHALTANETVTWSIVGGADAAQFEISGSTLRWVGNGVQDWDAPADANADNDYIVQVRATDTALNIANQTITCTVNSTAAPPAVVSTYPILGF